MKIIGIILLVISLIVLLAGIISPVNIIICTVAAVALFVFGLFTLRKH